MCNVAFNRQSVCVDGTSICWTHIGMKLLSCEETRGFLFEDPHTYLQILPHFTLLPIVLKSFYTLHVLATYYNSYFQIFPPVEWNDFTLCCKLILFLIDIVQQLTALTSLPVDHSSVPPTHRCLQIQLQGIKLPSSLATPEALVKLSKNGVQWWR